MESRLTYTLSLSIHLLPETDKTNQEVGGTTLSRSRGYRNIAKGNSAQHGS